jgi:hypothetical protein
MLLVIVLVVCRLGLVVETLCHGTLGQPILILPKNKVQDRKLKNQVILEEFNSQK